MHFLCEFLNYVTLDSLINLSNLFIASYFQFKLFKNEFKLNFHSNSYAPLNIWQTYNIYIYIYIYVHTVYVTF